MLAILNWYGVSPGCLIVLIFLDIVNSLRIFLDFIMMCLLNLLRISSLGVIFIISNRLFFLNNLVDRFLNLILLNFRWLGCSNIFYITLFNWLWLTFLWFVFNSWSLIFRGRPICFSLLLSRLIYVVLFLLLLYWLRFILILLLFQLFLNWLRLFLLLLLFHLFHLFFNWLRLFKLLLLFHLLHLFLDWLWFFLLILLLRLFLNWLQFLLVLLFLFFNLLLFFFDTFLQIFLDLMYTLQCISMVLLLLFLGCLFRFNNLLLFIEDPFLECFLD